MYFRKCRKNIAISLLLGIFTLGLSSCDTESVMSVVDTTNGKNGVIDKGTVSLSNTFNPKQKFTLDFASINDVADSEVIASSADKFDSSYREGAESFVKEFIRFVSNEYNNIESLTRLDSEFLGSRITDTERKVFDWWGKNINQVSETWYVDTVAYNNDEFYINTISRMKRDIDGEQKEVDVAVKWYVAREENGIRIQSASIISLDEVNECISSIIDTNKNVTIYNPSKSQGSEYKNISTYDTKAAESLVKVYKNSSVTLLSDTNEWSGVIIQPGYILTTYDNMYEANTIRVMFSDKTVKDVDGIVYADKKKNIAILKMTERVGTKLTLGEPDDIEIGEPVAAIGCAGENIEHVTCGNVYAKLINEYNRSIMLCRLPLTSDGSGSVVVNKNGDAIGIVVDTSNDFKEASTVISIESVRSEIDKIEETKWNDAKCIKLSNMQWK